MEELDIMPRSSEGRQQATARYPHFRAIAGAVFPCVPYLTHPDLIIRDYA